MPTTTNFGWTTPADTDLVKDGAAAIRTLGNGIDTSLLDLKGGTTGQVLSKNSNTDLDYTWVTPNVGDITEVQAGTGISVASGTGPIPVVTNDMATTITAAGDIVVGTGSGTYDNLPIGTTGQVLTADTTVSPYKVKWAAAAGGGFEGCAVFDDSSTTVSNTTFTALAMDSEIFDVGGYHSTSSNTSRITIPSGKGGYYFVYAYLTVQSNSTGERLLRIYKNGAFVDANGDPKIGVTTNGRPALSIATLMNLSAGDYIEVYVYQNSGGNLNFENNYFGCHYLGA